jgi:hypothetical protein
MGLSSDFFATRLIFLDKKIGILLFF